MAGNTRDIVRFQGQSVWRVHLTTAGNSDQPENHPFHSVSIKTRLLDVSVRSCHHLLQSRKKHTHKLRDMGGFLSRSAIFIVFQGKRITVQHSGKSFYETLVATRKDLFRSRPYQVQFYSDLETDCRREHHSYEVHAVAKTAAIASRRILERFSEQFLAPLHDSHLCTPPPSSHEEQQTRVLLPPSSPCSQGDLHKRSGGTTTGQK